jgi:hypothetical protein
MPCWKASLFKLPDPPRVEPQHVASLHMDRGVLPTGRFQIQIANVAAETLFSGPTRLHDWVTAGPKIRTSLPGRPSRRRPGLKNLPAHWFMFRLPGFVHRPDVPCEQSKSVISGCGRGIVRSGRVEKKCGKEGVR